ncbi:hypothetical protein F5Y19DRAFT_470798 [Xylariaceae sp. FL1651]|nr:hypothetical protein F5Y19DRAFT_470798 [Xylariaceae sp. FL1651]
MALPAIPTGCPEPGVDVLISQGKAPDAALEYRMHGSSWTVGLHDTEEAENSYMGALPSCVVVSVDYWVCVF